MKGEAVLSGFISYIYLRFEELGVSSYDDDEVMCIVFKRHPTKIIMLHYPHL